MKNGCLTSGESSAKARPIIPTPKSNAAGAALASGRSSLRKTPISELNGVPVIAAIPVASSVLTPPDESGVQLQVPPRRFAQPVARNTRRAPGLSTRPWSCVGDCSGTRSLLAV